MDGNSAAAYASYPFTEVAGIYPITPSSQMAEEMDEWAAKGRKNLFGQTVKVIEMQSEAGAAGTCHGSLQAGALTTTYTAAQGLLLMIPPMFRIAGEYLPAVFHVAARTVAQNMWSIYGDHSDVMACRTTGIAMLCSASPQEAMDLGTVAHLSAIGGRYPFIHFFDGFRTSHELQKIDLLDMEDLRPLLDWDQVNDFRRHALNPEHPFTRGTTPDGSVWFQLKEAGNDRYERLPDVVEKYMEEINKLTGRDYKLFNYYGAEDATDVVVAMGSMTETLKDTVDYLNKHGRKVGVVVVHLYRPFSAKHMLAAFPASVRRVAVLDRTKESGSVGEPLYLDVKAVLSEARPEIETIVGGRAGLSSKDTTPGMMVSVFDNLAAAEPKNGFTVGIVDDVTFKSLPWEEIILDKPGEMSCKLWGVGGDGTVGANKNSLKIIGDTTDMYCQAYFAYDAKKSGGVTQSHLRFGKDPIRATYLVNSADFVAVHNAPYLYKFDTVKDLKKGGKFLINCSWKPEEVGDRLPGSVKRALAEKEARLFVIDATDIAKNIGLGNRTNTVLQSAFFKLMDVIPMDVATGEMKEYNKKSYLVKRGQKVVDMNNAAVDGGVDACYEVPVPAEWKNAPLEDKTGADDPQFIQDLFRPMEKMEGDKIPVSVFKKYGADDGTWVAGTSRFDKRGDAVEVPVWDPEKCIQCNQCSFVCPHAAIRPALLDEKEKAAAPASFVTVPAKGKGMEGFSFRVQIDPMDCLGCANCVNACPDKVQALRMVPFAEANVEIDNWNFFDQNVRYKTEVANDTSVKSVMFNRPYYQFPPSCAGCGETSYVRLLSQLFGSRMYIANASGCTAAHGGCLPSTPFGKDERGFGTPWEQSLFEDNAEFGFGFLNAHETINEELVQKISYLKDAGLCAEECAAYLEKKDDGKASREVTDALLYALEKLATPDQEAEAAVRYIIDNKEYLAKKSVWCLGGDGWAYDNGYGGVDHVLAQNRDINMLILDTEVYSNTGGQSSKATPTGATAKFAAAGKMTKKKDLGMMLMSYGYIYVAQVSMGADPAQTLRAMREAEAYPGPAVVIAYAPCTAHGIPGGMANTQKEMKRAVESGYWTLYRYDPRLEEEGKNPFQLDSKAPTGSYLDFVRSESRYAALERSFPDRAKELFEKSAEEAEKRYAKYESLAGRN